MKKITLLTIVFLFAIAAQSQSLDISFEASEGYDKGELGGQNGWLNADSGTAPIFMVSDDETTDGDQSLNLEIDEDNVIEEGYLGLIDYPFEMNDSGDIYEVSYDFKFEDDEVAGKNTQISVRLDDGQSVIAQTTIGTFDIEGQSVLIAGFINADGFVEGEPIEFDKFYSFRIKLDYAKQQVEYFLDDQSIGSIILMGVPNNLGVLTAGASTVYVDNFVETTDMSVEDFEAVEFTHFTQDNQLFLSSDAQIGEVAIFNLLGQQVISETVNNISGNINLESLNTGVYMTKVSVNGQTKSFKFIKN